VLGLGSLFGDLRRGCGGDERACVSGWVWGALDDGGDGILALIGWKVCSEVLLIHDYV
jgi:hypothetical protein